MPSPTRPVFGGPDDGRPNPATPGEKPNYGKQIDRWKSQIKDGVSKKRQHKLRNKIQNARVDRWSDQTRDRANDPPAHDAAYYDDINAADMAYNQALIDRGEAYGALWQQGGFEAGFNDFAKNPFSRAAALDAAWKKDQRMTLNSYAAAGQLYSGARERERNRVGDVYVSNLNDEQNKYREALGQLSKLKPAAETAKGEAYDAAEREFGQRLQDNPSENAPPPPKFIKKEKRQLKNRLANLRSDLKDAKNKAKRRKITKRIKKAERNLNSIPDQYSEGKP